MVAATGIGGGGGRSLANPTLLFSFSAFRASILLTWAEAVVPWPNLVLKGSVWYLSADPAPKDPGAGGALPSPGPPTLLLLSALSCGPEVVEVAAARGIGSVRNANVLYLLTCHTCSGFFGDLSAVPPTDSPKF